MNKIDENNYTRSFQICEDIIIVFYVTSLPELNSMATGGADSTDANKRNLVVDEAAFEEQFLRCHICRERFDQQDKTPKSLPCNHTFCLPCLKQVA